MAKFKKGVEGLNWAAKSSSNTTFTPHVTWEDGETKYLQFLTPLDELTAVSMHQFMVTGYAEGGKPKYNHFIIDEEDPIQEKFGIHPTKRILALAAVLKPVEEVVKGRKKVVGVEVEQRSWETKDGEEKSAPFIGIINQTHRLFYRWLVTYEQTGGDPIEETIFAVTRVGAKTDTTYNFVPQRLEPLDLSEIAVDDLPDLDAYVDELADVERLHKLIDPLDASFPISKFAKLDKGKGEKAPASTRAPRAGARTAEPEAEATEEPAASEEEEAPWEEPKAGRRNGFRSMQRKIQGDDD